MKILWLCNIVIPEAGNALNIPFANVGGWLSALLPGLTLDKDLDVHIAAPYPGRKLISKNDGKIWYYAFSKEDCANEFREIINKVDPDIIHVHGTEFPYAKILIQLFPNRKYVVSIQGLVSIYAMHYNAFLPRKILGRVTFRDFIRRDSINQQVKKFEIRGKNEIYILKHVNNIIGRTHWDKACTHLINNNAEYYHCCESLRKSFYVNNWNYDKCEKHSVFLSQGNVPYKGLHLAIEAISILVEVYPDIVLYVAGTQINKVSNMNEKIHLSYYGKYINKLINELHMNDHIVFVGNLDESSFCNRMKKSNVYLSASTIENSPNSLGEAMLMGMPCVCSDVGGVTDMITHLKEGFVYPADEYYVAAEYIRECFDDICLAKEMGQEAKKHALITHDVSNNSNTLISIYKKIYNEQ